MVDTPQDNENQDAGKEVSASAGAPNVADIENRIYSVRRIRTDLLDRSTPEGRAEWLVRKFESAVSDYETGANVGSAYEQSRHHLMLTLVSQIDPLTKALSDCDKIASSTLEEEDLSFKAELVRATLQAIQKTVHPFLATRRPQ